MRLDAFQSIFEERTKRRRANQEAVVLDLTIEHAIQTSARAVLRLCIYRALGNVYRGNIDFSAFVFGGNGGPLTRAVVIS